MLLFAKSITSSLHFPMFSFILLLINEQLGYETVMIFCLHIITLILQ